MSGEDSPWVAGEWMFVISSDQQLGAVNRMDGRIAWVTDLPRWERRGEAGGPDLLVRPVAGRRPAGRGGHQRGGAGGQPLHGRDPRPAEIVRRRLARPGGRRGNRVRGDGRRELARVAVKPERPRALHRAAILGDEQAEQDEGHPEPEGGRDPLAEHEPADDRDDGRREGDPRIGLAQRHTGQYPDPDQGGDAVERQGGVERRAAASGRAVRRRWAGPGSRAPSV